MFVARLPRRNERELGQPVVIDNPARRGTIIGLDMLAKSPRTATPSGSRPARSP